MRYIWAVTFSIIPTKNRCFHDVIIPTFAWTILSHASRWCSGENPKSNVYKVLKWMVNTEAPQHSNTVIGDGMFLIQSTSRCLNYSIFAQKIVSSVLKLTQHRSDLYFWCLRVALYQRHKKEKTRKWRIWSCFFHWCKNKNGNRHAWFAKTFFF